MVKLQVPEEKMQCRGDEARNQRKQLNNSEGETMKAMI